MTNYEEDSSIKALTLNIFSSRFNFTSIGVIVDSLTIRFNRSKHTITRGMIILIPYLNVKPNCIPTPLSFPQHTKSCHHVVNQVCIKRPQKLQKMFDQVL